MADFLFSPVPHDEAVDFIGSKPVVSRDVFGRLLPELRARAFTITGVDAASAVQAIRDRIADLPAGATWDAVKKDIARQISPHFIDPSADAQERDKQIHASNRRAELLLRTHGFQAYQTASFDRMSGQKDVLPYWQYMSMGDGRVRPSHAALNGVVLPAASPFWHTHFPPWDFGCRCQAVPLSKEDHDDIQAADAGKLPEQQRIIEGPALKELELNNRLFRGPNQIANVSPPSGPGAYHWHPGDRDLTVDDLRQRYDAVVFSDFEQWARKTAIKPGQSVWQWISKVKPAAAGAAPAAPAPANAWPADLSTLKVVKKLGGATGAELVEDAATGRQFVRKAGANSGQLRDEAAADDAYRALGVAVPDTRVYTDAKGHPIKLSAFIDGAIPLRTALANAASVGERAAILGKVQQGFAADALLANWDVAGNWNMGPDFDNILVDKHGTPIRIDNGGALRYSGLGNLNANKLTDFPKELWTLRDPSLNPSTGQVFAGLDIYGIARQIEGIAARRADLMAALPVDLQAVVGQRLAHMEAVARKALDMEHDRWQAGYADNLTRHMMGLREAGIVARLPQKLDQAPGDVHARDEHGVPWDDLRTRPGGAAGGQAATAHPQDVFGPDLIAAAKTINHHNATGDFQYNGAKVAAALAHEPALQQLAQSPDAATKAMAQHYLTALGQVKASAAAGQNQQALAVPNVSPFTTAAGGAAAPAGSLVAQVAAYIAAQGGSQSAVETWMASQASDSWLTDALAYKHWIISQRTDAAPEYYWGVTSAAAAKPAFDQLAQTFGGEEKLGTALTAWHAFVQEALGATEFRYNDRSRRAVRLIRTESVAGMQANRLKPGDQTVRMKRGANESCSVFRAYQLHGDRATVQAVPHTRITGLYFLERKSGYGGGSFAGDHENEITATLVGVPLDYLKKLTDLKIDGGTDAASWGLDLAHLRP